MRQQSNPERMVAQAFRVYPFVLAVGLFALSATSFQLWCTSDVCQLAHLQGNVDGSIWASGGFVAFVVGIVRFDCDSSASDRQDT